MHSKIISTKLLHDCVFYSVSLYQYNKKKKQNTKNKIILLLHKFTCDPVNMIVFPRFSHMKDKAEAV